MAAVFEARSNAISCVSSRDAVTKKAILARWWCARRANANAAGCGVVGNNGGQRRAIHKEFTFHGKANALTTKA